MNWKFILLFFSGIRQLDNDQEVFLILKENFKKYIQSKKEKYHKKHKRSLWIRVSMAASACLICRCDRYCGILSV